MADGVLTVLNILRSCLPDKVEMIYTMSVLKRIRQILRRYNSTDTLDRVIGNKSLIDES